MNENDFKLEFTTCFSRICIDRQIDNAQDKGTAWIKMIEEDGLERKEVLRAIRALSRSDKRHIVFGDLIKQIEQERRIEI